MTPRETVKEYVRQFGLTIAPKPGNEPLIGDGENWSEVFDSWKDAEAFFRKAWTDHVDLSKPYPWSTRKGNPIVATSKKPTAKQLAARAKFTAMAKSGALAKKRFTSKKPARAKNPVTPGVHKGSAARQAAFTYEVQRWGANAAEWFRIAGFDYPEDAVSYAKAQSRKEPAWTLRVVDNYA